MINSPITVKFTATLLLALFAGSVSGQKPIVANEQRAIPQCDNSNTKVAAITAIRGLKSGSFISNLTADKFRVSSDREVFEVQCFSTIDEPLTVGIIIDLSSSIKKSSLTAAIRGVRKFMGNSNPRNTYFFVGFSGRPSLLLKSTNDTNQIDAFLANATGFQTRGKTAFHDAIGFAIGNLPVESSHRRVFLIFSDGEDNNSENGSRDALKKKLRDLSVRTYIATFITPRESITQEMIFNRIGLRRFAAETRGVFFTAEKETVVTDYFAQLGMRMRNEYRIGFNPAEIQEKWRPLTFEVKVPKDFEQISITGSEAFYY